MNTGSDILLTGGSGQVGRELQALAWPDGIRLVAPPRDKLDLADPRSIATFLSGARFAAILSCGAYTAVDKAEDEAETAFAINAGAPGQLAAAAAGWGVPIVHVSTDYVFDGARPEPYGEDDPVAPQGVYGTSKEAGERAVRAANPRHAIIRTAWVVSRHDRNFLRTMLRLGAERPHLRVVDDQTGTPTAAADLAQALQAVTLRLMARPTDAAHLGTFHFANAGATSWCGFAREIFRQSAALGGPSPVVEAITTADYPTRARRPAHSRLATDRIAQAFGIWPQPWQEAIAPAIRAILADTRTAS